MKTKTKQKKEKLSPLRWEEVRKYPIKLFHTLHGPIIGHVGYSDARQARVYAPARLILATPTNVLYQPVAFVEYYLDMQWSVMFGTSLVPDVIAAGYVGYVEQFSKGAYNMKPHVVNVDPPKGEAHEISTDAPLETCPACKSKISNWQAHYPVHLPKGNGRDAHWICEMDTPNIRDKYPGHTPERPQDA